MENKLVNNAMSINQSGEVEVDGSALGWAQRAFAMIATLGSIEGALSDEVVEALSMLLAKSPDDVLIGGTMMIVNAQNVAHGLGGQA